MNTSQKGVDYISLQEATKYCQYSQEYLSLRARQNKLKAEKLGRNWFTKKEWLEDYLKQTEGYKESVRPKTETLPPENLPVESPAQPFALDQVLPREIKEPSRLFDFSRLSVNFDNLAKNKAFNYFLIGIAAFLSVVWTGLVFRDIQTNPEFSQIVSGGLVPIEETYRNLGSVVASGSKAFDFALQENFKAVQELYGGVSNSNQSLAGKIKTLLASEAEGVKIVFEIIRQEPHLAPIADNFSYVVSAIGETGKNANSFMTAIFSKGVSEFSSTYNSLATVSSSELLDSVITTFSDYASWLTQSIGNQFKSLFR